MKKDIRELDLNDIKVFCQENGMKPYVSKQVYSWLWNKSCSSFEDMSNLSKGNREIFNEIEIVEWGVTPNFDMVVNATSIGLNNEDGIKLDYSQIEPNKFFYDVIYNPKETIFLKRAKLFGNKAENGKMMFIYQAHQAFTIWNKLMPKINPVSYTHLTLPTNREV